MEAVHRNGNLNDNHLSNLYWSPSSKHDAEWHRRHDEILRHCHEGFSNREIAQRTGCSNSVVQRHLQGLDRKRLTRTMKYVVRVRSFARQTKTYCWTPWETVGRFDTYEAAAAAAEAGQCKYHADLQRAVVFYRGKPYWKLVSNDDGRVSEFYGSVALVKWRA